MLKENDRRQYSITVDIDITYHIEHWRNVKAKMGLVDCMKCIRHTYPFLSMMETKRIAESI